MHPMARHIGGVSAIDADYMRTCHRICDRIFCENPHIAYFFRIYKLRFQNRICGNYAAYTKICISSHISAYAIAYMPHILHICRIFQRIISPNYVYFPAYFASKRPAYFKKNFRLYADFRNAHVFGAFLVQEPRVTTRFHTPNVAAHKMVCLKFEPACKSSIGCE